MNAFIARSMQTACVKPGICFQVNNVINQYHELVNRVFACLGGKLLRSENIMGSETPLSPKHIMLRSSPRTQAHRLNVKLLSECA